MFQLQRGHLNTEAATDAIFQKNYQRHLPHLKLKGLQPKTIDAYSRAIRRIGERFGGRIDDLSEQQLTDYFTELVGSHSWSTVKLDLHGIKFYYAHVLRKSWTAPGLIKAPKVLRLPDIVTVAEVQRLIATTRVLSYRVLCFTLYSMGLRLGEGLRLQVAASELNNELRRIRPVRTSAGLDWARELATNRATEAAERETVNGTNARACHYPQ